MKKNLLKLCAGLVLTLLVTACSKNPRMSALLEKLPADADVVVVGDLKTVVESAGGSVDGSKVKLSSFITDEMKGRAERELDELLDKVEDSGVDASACAGVGNFDDREPTYVFKIEDKEKFIQYIEDEDFDNDDEEDGVTYYLKENGNSYSTYGSCIAIDGDVAYAVFDVWEGGDFNPVKHVRKIIRNAKEESFGSTKFADYIDNGNAFGMAIKMPKELKRELKKAGLSNDLANLYTGVLCVRGSLDSDNAELNFKMFESDGKEKDTSALDKYMKTDGYINAKALAYLGEKDVFVYALSVKDVDWDKYLDDYVSNVGGDRASLAVVKSYLEKLDGTVALGIGLNDGITSMAKIERGKEVMKELPLTLVAETKEGKAKSIMNDLKALLKKQGVTFKSTSNYGLKIEMPDNNGSVNIASRGDLLIFSNHDIKESNSNPTVKAGGFDKANAVLALVLKKDNKLAKDLGLRSDIQAIFSCDVKGMEGTLKLSMDGDKSVGIIGKMAKEVLEVVNNANKIAEKYDAVSRRYSSYYGYYDSYDYDYADTVASDAPAYYDSYDY